MKKYSFVFLALILFLAVLIVFISCSDHETDGAETGDTILVPVTDTLQADTIVDTNNAVAAGTLAYTKQDEVYLILYEKISLGATFGTVKGKLSGIKPLHAEDSNKELAEQGLYESIQDITFLGHKGKLEFNFRNDSLYRYSLAFTEPNEKKAAELYENILNYYSERLGNYQPVNIEEDNHYAQINNWYLNPDYLVATYNLNTGNITVVAQTNKPGQQ